MKRLQDHGDLYLCMFLGVSLLVKANLTQHGSSAGGGFFGSIALAIGLLLLVLPGYLLGTIGGFERFGVVPFAGISMILSIATLAFQGTIVWLATNRFSLPLLENLLALWLILLGVLALWLRSRRSASDQPAHTFRLILCLALIPMVGAAVAITVPLGETATTSFTEFFLVTDESPNKVVIGNYEKQEQTYHIVAEPDIVDLPKQPFVLSPGQRWEVPFELPPASPENIWIMLYRQNDPAPYRRLQLSPR